MRALRLALAATYLVASIPSLAKGDALPPLPPYSGAYQPFRRCCLRRDFPPLPPYSGAYQPQSVDERGLWMEMDEAERALRDSKSVIHDARLNAYLHEVVCRSVGDDRCGAVRIYVMRDASFNASMAPNGMLTVNTGLLLRSRNEAEVAAVLGHEFAHFELRHSLDGFKQRRGASDIMAWAGVAAAGAYAYGGTGGYQTARTMRSVQVDALGSMFSFQREQERQADMLSMAYLKASSYDPQCFAQIWERLMDEADASARGRRQRSTRYDRVAFFTTHPTDLSRAGYLRDLAATSNKPGEAHAARYAEAMAAWRPQFLADQVKLNDFEGTDYLLGALAATKWTADLLFARGELYRTRGNPRDLVSAIGFYREALVQDPANADAYRAMGLAQLRNGDPAGAASLKTYLDMRPDANDRVMISALLT